MATANGALMEHDGLDDRDFDLPSRRPRPQRRRLYGTYRGYQRLVANPFVAILGFIGWCAAIHWIVQSKRLALFWPVGASFFLVVFLLQFHCVDCGKTDRLTRWRDHACDAVQRRYEAGFSQRVWFPNPVLQTTIWFYLILVVVFFIYGLLR